MYDIIMLSAHHAEKYNVTANETSLSGFSSGAYMAVQFHVSYSKIIKGAGITAGGSYSYTRRAFFYHIIR